METTPHGGNGKEISRECPVNPSAHLNSILLHLRTLHCHCGSAHHREVVRTVGVMQQHWEHLALQCSATHKRGTCDVLIERA